MHVYIHIRTITYIQLVELPDNAGPQRGKRCSECGGRGTDEKEDLHDTLLQSKMESVLFEYNDMLTRTLEAQRHFFESESLREKTCMHV